MVQIVNVKQNIYGEMQGEFFCDCLNKNIQITYSQNLPLEFLDKSIKHLNFIYAKLLSNLCMYTCNYCKEIMNEYPDIKYKVGLYNIKNELDVLNYVDFYGLKIQSYNNDIVLNLSGGCDWSEERGIQWIIYGTKIAYVGEWDDFDIDSPDLNDPFFNYCTRS